MIQKNALSEVESNDIHPTRRQQIASNPQESIWVGASAGTGKTKVLTDRVLRLLLPREDGQGASAPHRILCLTFTKAAASEMALRINKILGQWAIAPEEDVIRALEELFGRAPQPVQIEAAQRLFADVMDSQGGLQIMTIHSFCQSVLGRFPLEAAIQPNFTLLDDRESAELLEQAKGLILKKAQGREAVASPLADAMQALGGAIDEAAFSALIREMASERNQMAQILRNKTALQVYTDICSGYDIPQNASPQDAIAAFCTDTARDEAGLRETVQAMQQEGGKTSLSHAGVIRRWLEGNAAKRVQQFESYREVFLIGDGSVRKGNFPVNGVLKIYPQARDVLGAEGERILAMQERANRMKSAQLTRDILIVGQEILQSYADLKRLRGGLDFDDLILSTMDLLRGDSPQMEGIGDPSAWVMYKLDQGLDQILVDEAQDTNPEQWKIIEALCDEFFSGRSTREERSRSAFVVGDIKQSIYSFQRAAPEEFRRMQDVFEQKITDAGQISRRVDLETSFRSTRSVLRLVDQVFAQEDLNKAVGGGDIHHRAYRAGQGGCAEIWPLFEADKAEKFDLWNHTLTVREQKSATVKMAQSIAQKISDWIMQGEMLHSAGRPVQAGDIMVLVRSRSAFVEQLVRALKEKRIPVSGADRMELGAQLVVQDLLSLARFVLLPEDDLNLACVLKSPFLGWSEDDLFALCYGRKGSLWAALQQEQAQPRYAVAAAYLKAMQETAKTSGTYEFFTSILQQSCPADPISGLRAIKGRLGEDALDPMEELLNAAMAFGRRQVNSLQLFIEVQEQQDTQIKRELEESGGKVRIMTVHGSKGLQAPIVILPDTVPSARGKKMGRLLWPAKTGKTYPLWSVRKEDDPQPYADLLSAAADRARQEEGRLLYVAMTRAADRLYITGALPSAGKIEGSWYESIRKAFENDAETIEGQDGILRLENPQTASPDQRDKRIEKQVQEAALPDWIHQPAPQEPSPLRPLIPSRPSKSENPPSVLSPLRAAGGLRFLRGNITHKLLQFLPDLEEGKRREAAQHFVRKNGADLGPEVQEDIVREVCLILEKPDYAPFFKGGSLAEVPITGLTAEGRIISGQIDRLVMSAQDIWILDYKTNRPPPTDPKDIPQVYRDQLSAYRQSIAIIYPQHRIHCALLWTDGPRLMIVD